MCQKCVKSASGDGSSLREGLVVDARVVHVSVGVGSSAAQMWVKSVSEVCQKCVVKVNACEWSHAARSQGGA